MRSGSSGAGGLTSPHTAGLLGARGQPSVLRLGRAPPCTPRPTPADVKLWVSLRPEHPAGCFGCVCVCLSVCLFIDCLYCWRSSPLSFSFCLSLSLLVSVSFSSRFLSVSLSFGFSASDDLLTFSWSLRLPQTVVCCTAGPRITVLLCISDTHQAISTFERVQRPVDL